MIRDDGLPAEHPESMIITLADADEVWLARASNDMWPADEYAEIVAGGLARPRRCVMTGPACWYCERTGQPLEPCAGHPGDLVCADRQGCRDFIRVQLDTGPYEMREQASAAPAVQAIYAAMRADTAGGAMTRGGRDLIEGACQRAGVTLGAYDRRIIEWAAGFDPAYAAVIAGLVTRAAALTGEQRDVLVLMAADALEYRVEPVAGKCDDCDKHPALLCPDHAADLDRAERYRTVLRQLGVPGDQL